MSGSVTTAKWLNNEENYVINRVMKLINNRVLLQDIAILSRTNKKLYKIENFLASRSIQSINLETSDDNINFINN